jgi:hypothetical protein
MLQEFSERFSRQAGLSSRARVSSLGVKAISALNRKRGIGYE